MAQLTSFGLGMALVCGLASSSDSRLIPHVGVIPIPTAQQLKYLGGMNALIHFGMATFFMDGDPGCTRQNWNGCQSGGGCNSSNPKSFAPTNLNIDGWIESFKALGVDSAVLTAKHGCGFLAWETNVTLPGGAPYTYHVPPTLPVAQLFAEKVAAANLGHGFYYSLTNNQYLNVAGHNVQPASTLMPGQVAVTQAQFEDIALAQVTELWTQFGNLTEIWLDGGCGAMCDRIGALVRKTNAAGAVAFNGGGVSDNPVRWCGTEGGEPEGWPTIWITAVCPDGWCGPGSGSGNPPNMTGAFVYPSGVDVTLQQGDHWFITPGAPLHPLSDLIKFYHRSVGANGHLEIDFAIDRTGGIDPKHAAAYAAFGGWIRSCYGTPLASTSMPKGDWSVQVPFTQGATNFDRVMMEEDLTAGQLIATYTMEARVSGAWKLFSSGTSVGKKRIDVGAASVLADAVRFNITAAFAAPSAVKVSVFAPGPCATGNFEYQV